MCTCVCPICIRATLYLLVLHGIFEFEHSKTHRKRYKIHQCMWYIAPVCPHQLPLTRITSLLFSLPAHLSLTLCAATVTGKTMRGMERPCSFDNRPGLELLALLAHYKHTTNGPAYRTHSHQVCAARQGSLDSIANPFHHRPHIAARAAIDHLLLLKTLQL